MSYLDCGCWVGPWHSINPPPRCDGHRGAGVYRGGPFIDRPRQPEPVTEPVMVTRTVTLPAQVTLESSIKVLLELAQTEIAVATGRGDTVALDAWREAYEQIQNTIIALARAKKASAATTRVTRGDELVGELSLTKDAT